MTFQQLIAKVLPKAKSDVNNATDEQLRALSTCVVVLTLQELGCTIDEATDNIVMPGHRWEPPAQQNVRYRGQPRRRR